MKTGIFLARRCAVALAVAAAFPVLSQTTEVAALKEVVVSATRAEQPLTDVVADVSIVDRAEIERSGAVSILGVLARQPGVQAIAGADRARVYLRGADSRMTAVYIDGVRVDSQDGLVLGGGAPWEQIPIDQIDRIEILRGPASAVYGSDAMGGVIQLFTRRGEDGIQPYLSVGMGSFNQVKSAAGVTGAQNGWSYALGATSQTSDGFDNQPQLTHTSPNLPVSQQSYNLRLARNIVKAHTLELTALSSQTESQYSPWNGGTNYKVKSSLSTTAARWQAQWSPVWKSNVTLSRGVIAQKDTTPYDYFTVTQGLLWDNQVQMQIGTLSVMIEQKKDKFEYQTDPWGGAAFEGERMQNAVGLGWGAHVGRHTWQLNARQDRDDLFGSRDSGAASYAFALTPQWRAAVSHGTAYKPPTLEQLYGSSKVAGLQPESNVSSEVSLGYVSGVHAVKLVAYQNRLHNMISSSPTTFQYFNIEKASVQGATLSAQTRFAQLGLRGSVDVLDARDDTTGKQLSLRARQSASLGADWTVGSWVVGVEVQHTGERFNEAANTNLLPAFELLNLYASKSVGKDVRLVVRADNALDTRYAPIKDYVAPRATYFVGLQWQPRN